MVVFKSVLIIIFKNIFYLKLYYNNIYFLYQYIKIIWKYQKYFLSLLFLVKCSIYNSYNVHISNYISINIFPYIYKIVIVITTTKTYLAFTNSNCVVYFEHIFRHSQIMLLQFFNIYFVIPTIEILELWMVEKWAQWDGDLKVVVWKW